MNRVANLSDTISSIRNQYSQRSKFSYVPNSVFIKNLLIFLQEEALITGAEVISDRKIKIGLKYFKNKPLISEIALIYKPSEERFCTFNKLRGYRKKYDIFFVSTSDGILSSRNLSTYYEIEKKTAGLLLFGIKLSKLC